ncbi:hypothetical protein LTV02_07155 [Nocardia yamanashiensis]|uniref:hypothetical protein n=1 Tax=Nocardia yamanashiensis TaxID=209247 RepID=UPI001E336597|nr:hypothetical protein [Nocardia yamanashiensis]UGT43161.1 hypothetical protein LTV02_07155 [Nocardia yamanashiensis]
MTNSRLDQAQIAVLDSLAPGGLLAIPALARSSRLTLWRTRSAVSKLSARGLITGRRRAGIASWEITDRGRRTLSTRARYHR